MTIRTIAAAAALTAALASVASAETLQPIENQHIDLGGVVGDAYYTVEPGGYRVVATFGTAGQAAMPVRFVAVLAPGQTVTFSTPAASGLPATAVEIVRQNDGIVVHKAPTLD